LIGPDVLASGVSVRVPATSANLGSAFDCAGLALAIYNDLTVARADHDQIVVIGEGQGEVGLGPENLALRAIEALFRATGNARFPLHLVLNNGIPLGRGLGSSSAAIVGGLVAANLLLGSPCDKQALLKLAVELEGHGDNVAAALHGGLTLYVKGDDHPTLVTLPAPTRFTCVLFVPDVRVATNAARAALPASVPRSDAVFNVGRAALLVAALALGQKGALRVAMQDRLHEQYRSSLFPAGTRLCEAALASGALGSAVSGSGPTIIALADNRDIVAAVEQALRREADTLGVSGKVQSVSVASRGARRRAGVIKHG
jgi:homoserine kinase